MKTLLRWLIFLHSNEDGFFGIGEGPSGNENREFGATAGIGNFGTSLGEKDLTSSSNFWQSILSGDPSKISTVLGPEFSAINKQGQQKKKTAAEFGNRGGGTNASMQMEDENTRTQVNSLLGSLTGSAASNLGNLGSSLLSTGLSAHEGAFDMSKVIHDQNLAKWNDLFKSIAEVGLAPFTGGASLGAGSLSLPGGGGGAVNPDYVE